MQTMTPAGLGTSITMDSSPHGQPCRAWSLQQASEALREHLLPHLGLPTLMALSRASSDWHQLILTTPLTQLAGHANRDLLPYGMTSHQPLREVLQERGSLLGRLRRHHNPGNGIGLAAPGPMQNRAPCHQQGMCTLTWSPQPDITQPSQHILIWRLQAPVPESGHHGYERIASVLHLPTGRPVDFRAARSCSLPVKPAALGADPSQKGVPGRGRHPNDMVQPSACNDQQAAQEHILARCTNIRHGSLAAWAADARHVIITLSDPQTSPHPADSSERTGSLILADTLLHSRRMLFPQAHERFLAGAISPAGNIIPSQSSSPTDCLNMYQLPNMQHQFSVGPPISPYIHCLGPFEYQQIAWSPDGAKVAVWWVQDRPTVTDAAVTSSPSASSISDYVTIHCADDGRCLTSTLISLDSHADGKRSTQDSGSTANDDSGNKEYSLHLQEEDESEDDDSPQIEWDSSSSYVLWTHKDTIACIWPEQGQLWRSSCQERVEFQLIPGGTSRSVGTMVGSASSGQLLLVADCFVAGKEFLTMLDASTGRVMSQWSVRRETNDMVWAAQSDVCLLPNHSFVLVPAAADVAVGNAHTSGVAHENIPGAFSRSDMSTGHPSCNSKDSGINQHAWHKFALAAPALPGSDGLSSPANSGRYETYTMHISPCGAVVVGVQHHRAGAIAGQPSGSKATFQHWHLPHVRKCPAPNSAGNGTLDVRPQECIGLVMASRRTLHLAWHPQPRACTYACYDYKVGLRLVNAKSDSIVRSWTIAELAACICEDSAMPAGIESLKQKQSSVMPGSALAWSHDGCRLAVLLGKHCAVLHF